MYEQEYSYQFILGRRVCSHFLHCFVALSKFDLFILNFQFTQFLLVHCPHYAMEHTSNMYTHKTQYKNVSKNIN